MQAVSCNKRPMLIYSLGVIWIDSFINLFISLDSDINAFTCIYPYRVKQIMLKKVEDMLKQIIICYISWQINHVIDHRNHPCIIICHCILMLCRSISGKQKTQQQYTCYNYAVTITHSLATQQHRNTNTATLTNIIQTQYTYFFCTTLYTATHHFFTILLHFSI